MTAVVVLVMLVLSIAGGGGAACPGVPSMIRNETCLAACTATPALYGLCRETLANVSSGDTAQEVTVYALAAARRVALAYDETVDRAERLIVGGALASRDEREAYQGCIASYGVARGEVAGVEADLLARCEFGRTGREYGVAVAAVEACGEALEEVRSPLRERNAADRDLTEVAAGLGALVLGQVWES